ncbi:MAG: 3-phosphoshikimate 1-carboxyvinyltransferase [Crocinitomicaceae bacterium]
MTRHTHITKKGGLIKAPSSKSFAQRALFAASLSQNSTLIEGLGKSEDVLHIQQIIEQLGFELENKTELTKITKSHQIESNSINVGESGLGTRLSVPLISHFLNDYQITGKGTLLKRPMAWFESFLPQMGLNIELTRKCLPLYAKGKINSGHYCVDGSESSQYISGLLMTLPICNGDSILEVKNPVSIPYIDITLSLLSDFGIEIINQDYNHFIIKGNQNYESNLSPYQIEGDYSGAAFWIVYGLLNNGISISNLNPNSVQADAAILKIVESVGGTQVWKNSILKIIPPNQLKPFEFDATHCPDLFPILTTLAAGINGRSILHGTNRLIFKESNRKVALLEEFSKLDLEIESINDSLIIYGTGKLKSGDIDSHGDHRIAMALAIASFLTPKGINISDPICVNKSYPEFWEILNIL